MSFLKHNEKLPILTENYYKLEGNKYIYLGYMSVYIWINIFRWNELNRSLRIKKFLIENSF